MSNQQYERHVPGRGAVLAGFRQKGYVAGKYGRTPLSDERLRALGGEAAVRVYREGLRTGERERGR